MDLKLEIKTNSLHENEREIIHEKSVHLTCGKSDEECQGDIFNK